MLEQARDHNVAALDQAQRVLGRRAGGRVQELRGPGACRVDQAARPDSGARACGAEQRGVPVLGAALDGAASGTGQHPRAAFASINRRQHHQARIVDPAVRILETTRKSRLQFAPRGVAAQGQRMGTGQKFTPRQAVVQTQAGPDHPRRALAAVVRHHKAQRPHDMGSAAQQHFTLEQRLAYQAEGIVFEVAQAAVYQFARSGRRVGSQVILLAQHHRQAAPCRVARDAGAIDTAANHQNIAFDRSHAGDCVLKRAVGSTFSAARWRCLKLPGQILPPPAVRCGTRPD